ncbi:hypothetical protein MRGR3_2233 [Staphylococcus aureus subsp. aureus MRGR3]|nr:hypothetical protein MRGR3_2233 [Staphylococcus aureus subsp. aureus MRGR3]
MKHSIWLVFRTTVYLNKARLKVSFDTDF